MSKTTGDSEGHAEQGMYSSADNNAIHLVPQPTDHPDDPLNWSFSRKLRLLLVSCLAAFAGNVSALAGQDAYPVQAKLYNVTVLDASYSVSAAMAGLATGALFCVPLTRIFGRWSVTFWSLIGSLACAIWSARMTSENDYIEFIISRLLSGLFGAIPSAVGGSMIFDVFYLHQRGRAFICYGSGIIFGATAGPTFSGFIAGTTSWTWCFWWTVPLLVITAGLVLVFAEETGFDRDLGRPLVEEKPKGFVGSRVATFFPGTAVVSAPSVAEVARSAIVPMAIMFSPVTILCGLFTLIVFGWLVVSDVLLPTFLQDPIKDGGYGFTPTQNAAFSFAGWAAVIVSQLIGMVVNDGLPLWICKRYYNGIWRPELRLYATIISVIICPIGLGIIGVAIHRHLHYMVFALGYFTAGFSGLVCVPVATNYIAESFTHYGSECTLVMTFYRLAWGIAVPFFMSQWVEEVGVNWVYGMSALITVAAWMFIWALLWKGHELRSKSLVKSLVSSEDGQRLFGAESTVVLS